MKLPKLYAPVKIKFWSLRNGLGSKLGIVFDIDIEVERKCRRVLCGGGWKWQLVDYLCARDLDYGLEHDKEILDNYGSELEFEYA